MMVGPIIMASPPAFWGLWGAVVTISVSTSHSGYVPEIGGSEEHDMHHELFNCNYGVALYLGDRCFGTYFRDAHSRSGGFARKKKG